MFEEELRKYAINTKFSQEYTHAISETKRVSWNEFEPTKFVYAFFNFNTIYQVDWENSIGKNQILSWEKHINEKGESRNLSEPQQQNGLFKFILDQINFQDAVEKLSEALNNLENENINIVGELRKITTDGNINDTIKRKFTESIENILNKNFHEKDGFYKSLKEILNLIYNVRNNIFHGNKDRFQLENREQQIRLRIYAEITQTICQLAIEAIAKKANCPNILNVKFEKENVPRIRRQTIELTSDKMNEIFRNIPQGNLFYPCSGVDTYTPLQLFLETPIETFYFADISYLRDLRKALPFETEVILPNQSRANLPQNQTRQQQFGQANSLIRKEFIVKVEKKQTQPIRRDFFSLKTDFGEIKLPYPQFSKYELTLASGQSKQLQISCGDAFSAFQLINKISVFFYRFDGRYEGGSNQLWFSESLFPQVLEKMENGGLLITDGGNGIESGALKLKSDVESFKYKNVTFVSCGKIDKDKTRVWKIEK